MLKLERNEIAYIIRYFSKLRERAKERTRSLMKKRREKLIGERRTIIHEMIVNKNKLEVLNLLNKFFF